MPDSFRLSHRGALLVALLVTVLWSSSWVLIRWGLEDDLEPLTFAALRYGLAALVLVSFVLSNPRLRNAETVLNRRSLIHVAVLGVVFYTVTQGAQFVAISVQPAATTSVVLSWTPLLVGLIGGWSIAERASSRQLAGAALVAVGAWLYFSGGLLATTLGILASLTALAGNTVSSLLGRYINRDGSISPILVTALSMTVGALVLVAVGVSIEGVPSLTFRSWAIITWLAVVNTALAFSLWNLTLKHLSAIESSVINNTMLIQIAVLAWVFLGETFTIWEAVGILIVSLGVLITQNQPRANRP